MAVVPVTDAVTDPEAVLERLGVTVVRLTDGVAVSEGVADILAEVVGVGVDDNEAVLTVRDRVSVSDKVALVDKVSDKVPVVLAVCVLTVPVALSVADGDSVAVE